MKPQRLTEQERFNRLRLARTDSIGPANYRRLLHRFGSAEEALARLPDLSKRGGRSKPLAPPPIKEIEAELEAAAKLGAQYFYLGEEGYPEPLAATERLERSSADDRSVQIVTSNRVLVFQQGARRWTWVRN